MRVHSLVIVVVVDVQKLLSATNKIKKCVTKLHILVLVVVSVTDTLCVCVDCFLILNFLHFFSSWSRSVRFNSFFFVGGGKVKI